MKTVVSTAATKEAWAPVTVIMVCETPKDLASLWMQLDTAECAIMVSHKEEFAGRKWVMDDLYEPWNEIDEAIMTIGQVDEGLEWVVKTLSVKEKVPA